MRITQSFTFEAAHRLPKVAITHRCHNVHGHSFRVEIDIEGPVNPDTGFVVDFFEIENAFNPVWRQLDHQLLNGIIGLENPTSENIAIWIWNQMIAALPGLVAVRIFETPNSWAEYSGD